MRWEQRPVEVANLLNPPFCAILLREAIQAYEQKDSRGMSYLLIYLILPFVVHAKTRHSIPNRPNYTFIEWLERQKTNSMILTDRIQQLTLFTKEGLLWGIQEDVFKFGSEEDKFGNLVTSSRVLQFDESWSPDSTPVDCKNKARIIGTWFAEIGDVTTIYRSLGIRP